MVRHTECSVLLETSTSCNRCTKCVSYRTQLNVLVDWLRKCHDNSNPQSHTNYRYLSDSEKNSLMKELHHNMRTAQKRVAHLQEKLRESTEVEGEKVDESTSADLQQIMEDNDTSILKQYPKESFLYLFWTQQKEALTKSSTKGMRWHPLMIRWCLYLRHHSFQQGVRGTSRSWSVSTIPENPKRLHLLHKVSNRVLEQRRSTVAAGVQGFNLQRVGKVHGCSY